MDSSSGLILLFTGNGKGKTTAALGMALRAVGHGLHVRMLQFLKADTDTGECLAAPRLGPLFSLETLGCGFVPGPWSAADIRAARNAWAAACEALRDPAWNLVILDEVTYCIREGVLSADQVVCALRQRPPGQHVVLTGRAAPQALIDAADLVTEMQAIKHPYDAGVRAQPGVEF
jgi:cob(I)alamin adenosyltransferase